MIEDISNPAAMIAGLLSFFSPCILPLVPSYFTFITGLSLEDLTGSQTFAVHRKVIFSTMAFILGFSTVFVLLGASASYVSGLILEAKTYLRITGGVLIILLGLHLVGILRIRALLFEKRLNINKKPLHFFGVFLIGMAFGAGWSPCIGPLLGTILILAGSQESVGQGIMLLSLYSAGLAIPFLFLSVFISFLIRFVRRTAKLVRYFNFVAGVLLIITGLLLITDKLRLLSYF
jgi:cytochrome c-type biogenesis protein